jgi:membrane-associated protein
MARFVPIVRTFITVTAGVGRMPRRRYLTASGAGAVLWATGVTVLGYYLGSIALVREHIEAILLLIVLVSVLPVLVEVLRERRRRRVPSEAELNARDAELREAVLRDADG